MTRPDLSGAAWRKSSRSSAEHNCVEIAPLHGSLVAIRDSKNPSAGNLVLDRATWQAFVAGATEQPYGV